MAGSGERLVVHGVHQWYFSAERRSFVMALSNLNLTIEPGRFVALLGPSGCGKSTLLNMIAGLIKPSIGRISYGDKEIDGPNIGAGYVTQNDSLLPWRRVAANIALPLEIKGVPREEREARVEATLRQVGLQDFGHFFPSELSGGMRKRVGLARVLVTEPHLVLMDEPFSALDAQLRAKLHGEFLALWMKRGMTVIFVTHDIEEAVALSEFVYVFAPSPGRITAGIRIDIDMPRNMEDIRYTKTFTDYCQLLRDELRHGEKNNDGEEKDKADAL